MVRRKYKWRLIAAIPFHYLGNSSITTLAQAILAQGEYHAKPAVSLSKTFVV
jgi:hypothetical protein